jgi:hypothetical protein
VIPSTTPVLRGMADGIHCIGRSAVFSGVQQSFSTITGKTYVVSFKMSGNPEGLPQIKRFRVSVDQFKNDYEFDSAGQSIGARPRLVATGVVSTDHVDTPVQRRCTVPSSPYRKLPLYSRLGAAS